jgi:hypothetical protein
MYINFGNWLTSKEARVIFFLNYVQITYNVGH